MISILGPGKHPLQFILRSHIGDLSMRKGGFPDLSCLVTQGGRLEIPGLSTMAQHLQGMDKIETAPLCPGPAKSAGLVIPLWRPHCNDLDLKAVKCSSRAQRSLRMGGLQSMGDVLSPTGGFLAWQDRPPIITATGRSWAYTKLLSNLRDTPIIEPTPGPHSLFFADSNAEPGNVAPQDLSASWAYISAAYTPVKSFRARASALSSTPVSSPPTGSNLHRVILRLPWGKGTTSQTFGPLTPENALLLQYGWRDGTPLLNTLTAQLHHVQAQQRHFPRRSANENAFLWQEIFRVIATQRWCFPTRPHTRAHTDITTWYTRCTLGTREDIIHCLWSCPLNCPPCTGNGGKDYSR